MYWTSYQPFVTPSRLTLSPKANLSSGDLTLRKSGTLHSPVTEQSDDRFYCELLKYVAGEPCDIGPGTNGMIWAQIAKELIAQDPEMATTACKDRLLSEIKRIELQRIGFAVPRRLDFDSRYARCPRQAFRRCGQLDGSTAEPDEAIDILRRVSLEMDRGMAYRARQGPAGDTTNLIAVPHPAGSPRGETVNRT